MRSTLARLQAEGLVDARPKRTVTVEARDVFGVRKALEREAAAIVIKCWRPEFGAEVEGHVREEDASKARGDDRVSIRLAGEFHIKLAAMSGNCVLERYRSELVSCCSPILALYGRPHSSKGAVNEHSAIIAALRQGDTQRAIKAMDEHLGAVEKRALIAESVDAESGLGSVLSRYAGAIEARRDVISLPATKRKRQAQ